MSLTHPPASSFQYFNFFIVFMRKIFFFQTTPCIHALFMTHFWMGIDFMLEMIHQNTIRQEFKTSGHMRVIIAIYIFFKETLHPRMRKEFHGHRMNLTRFIGWPNTVTWIDISGLINLISVPCLVGQDLGIVLRLIKIRKNKRTFIIGHKRTITTGCLARFTVKIQ